MNRHCSDTAGTRKNKRYLSSYKTSFTSFQKGKNAGQAGKASWSYRQDLSHQKTLLLPTDQSLPSHSCLAVYAHPLHKPCNRKEKPSTMSAPWTTTCFSLGNSSGTVSSPALTDSPKRAWGWHSPSLAPRPSYHSQHIRGGRAECSLAWPLPAQQQMPVSHPSKIKH